MSNYVIGNQEIDPSELCSLKFHQYNIYNSIEWTQSGQLYWDAVAKQIIVIPNPLPLNSQSLLSDNKGKESIKTNENSINTSSKLLGQSYLGQLGSR